MNADRLLDRAYPVQEIRILARERLAGALDRQPPFLAAGACLAVLRATFDAAVAAGGPIEEPWRSFHAAVVEIGGDVERLLSDPRIATRPEFGTLGAMRLLGDSVIAMVRNPQPLPWMVEMACLGLELQRQASRSVVEAGTDQAWEAVRLAMVELLILAASGPLELQEGERVH